LHSNVAPASADEKPNEAALDATVPLGPAVIEVSGAVVSTVQVRVAGVGSMLPAPFLARVVKVCGPLPSPE
jgi:hypothetical protein